MKKIFIKLLKILMYLVIIIFLFISITIFTTLMLFSVSGIINSVSNHINLKNLKEYDAVILYLENYKKENGIYPDNIDDFKFKAAKMPFYKYVSESGNQNYILYVSKDELTKTNNDDEYKNYANFNFFQYCSNQSKCDKLTDSSYIIVKIGNWYEWEMD